MENIVLKGIFSSVKIIYPWDSLWMERTFDSGLNKISCPTKIYSYGLLGIIGFLESKCSDQLDKIREKDLDIGFLQVKIYV